MAGVSPLLAAEARHEFDKGVPAALGNSVLHGVVGDPENEAGFSKNAIALRGFASTHPSRVASSEMLVERRGPYTRSWRALALDMGVIEFTAPRS